MSYPIIDIEGIGPVYAEKLKAAGITTTDALLDAAKDRRGNPMVIKLNGTVEPYFRSAT